MTVDGIREEPSKNYIFPSSGNHTVHILLDITNCKSLNSMFCDINKIVSIIFLKILILKILKRWISLLQVVLL